MSRRGFLSSAAGMSAAFLAMNEVFGPVFTASRAEAATPGVADARAAALKKQFIVDCQTHFVRDDYTQQLLMFSADFAKKHWNPDIPGSEGLTRYKFQNYVKEIFIDSDTKVAMISGTPTDEYEYLFLTNDQIASARDVVNKVAGSRRTLAHGIVTPGTPGWFEEITRVMTDLKPDSIKGYTIGDPIYQTKKKTNWRMDDEKLVYPLYEAMLKNGINTICIHKGLMPADYMTSWADMWQYATVWDVGKAAKDWPQINFVIYHSAMRPFLELPDRELAQFEKTGRFDWVSDLADIPAKFGVKQCLRRARRLLRQHLRHASQAGGRAHGHAHQGPGRGQGDLGHGLGVVGFTAVADRGHAPARDPRGHAEEVRLQAARRRGWPGEDQDLRRQRLEALQDRSGRGREDVRRQLRCDQGGVPGDGRVAEQPAIRLRQRLTEKRGQIYFSHVAAQSTEK